jgi:two-component system cell cycle response regulator
VATAPTDPLGTARHAARLVLGTVLFGGAVAVSLYDWLGVGGAGLDSAVNGPLSSAVIVAAGLACLLKAQSAKRERGAWIAIGLAVLAWGAAEIYWTLVLRGQDSPPYPSPADIGYLAFYPLAVLGLYLLVRTSARQLDWRLWMDGLIAALGTAALGAAIVFEYVADRTTGTSLEVATTLAYPLGDILMLALAIGIVGLTRWRPGRTWILLLLGLGALVIADVAFTLQEAGGLPEGAWIEPIYLIGAVCIGAEAWQPKAQTIRKDARFDGWRELVVPGFFAIVMMGLFTIQVSSTNSALTTILTAATMLAVVARLALSVRDNKRLLEAIQIDQLTGLRNRGGLQVDLERCCARGAESPATLQLLDLNGFKRYNDTFGHPAGDELLMELGGRLREWIGPDCTAYRVGGDEFAVLVEGSEGRREAVTKLAAEALRASGSGFEVSAAFGTAAIPAEADSPRAAMQLADVRMYAQKEARRAREGGLERIDDDLDLRLGPLGGPGDSEAVEQRK